MRVEGQWCRRGIEAAQEQIPEGRRQGSRGKAIGRHPPGPFADAPTGTVGTTPGRCPGHHSGSYADDCFSVWSRSRSQRYLRVLESIYIFTTRPILCRQKKEFVYVEIVCEFRSVVLVCGCLVTF